MSWLRAIYQREELELHHVLVAAAIVAAFLAGIGVAGRDAVVFNRTATLAQGPDISRWQGTLSCSFWNGQAFGLAKAGGADAGEYQDPQYSHNIACLRQHGIDRGSYFFASPPAPDPGDGYAVEKSWGAQQAGYYAGLVNANGGLQIGEAAMLDLETGSGDQSAFAAAFLSTLKAKLGVRPLIYASLGYIGGHLGSRGAYGLGAYPLDLADWYYGSPPSAPTPWPGLTLWQWSDSGCVNGVCPVDLNYQIGAWPGKPTPPPAPPAPASPYYHDAALYNATDGYTLDGWGGLHAQGAAATVSGPNWPGWDIARSVAVLPNGSGLVLDGWGGLHPFGAAPPTLSGGLYWPGWDIAGKVALGAEGGYVMDDWGGLHAFSVNGATAPTATGGPYWSGWSIARDLALIPGSNQGYVLDGWGGIHPFNGAPAVSGYAYWPGWDIARSIALNPDGSGGYTMDAWGGIHPFAISGHSTPAAICGGPYWPGWSIAADLVLTAPATGIVLDGLGGVHSFKAC